MNKIMSLALFVIMILSLCCCTKVIESEVVDIKSGVNGLNRTINVYTANGDLLASYTGEIYIAKTDGGYVKFDFAGKRYIYYNCFVETIADIK